MSRARPRLRERIGRTSLGGRIPLAAFVALCVVAVVVAVAVGALRSDPNAGTVASSSVAAPGDVAAEASATIVQPGTVEIPDVVGKRREDAEVILAAAGLTVKVRSPTETDAIGGSSGLIVESQDPEPGVLVAADAGVTISLAAPRVRATVTASAAKKPPVRWVVCIDPGHQGRGDSSPEPIGPGSDVVKPRVTGGATGAKTGIPEYEIALQISMNLKAQLEARGVKVVMTRTTSDVNLSNGERAGIANRADADLFVRIHGDGSPDASAAGISTLFPASNTWTRSFAPQSTRAARLVQLSVVRSTGAVNRGTASRSDLSGFNWAKVPCVLVECGFLSNSVEDRLLASPHYQDKVASGIAEGVVAYLREGSR